MTNRWHVLALLGTAFFMTILDGTSLLSALPSLNRDLGLQALGELTDLPLRQR